MAKPDDDIAYVCSKLGPVKITDIPGSEVRHCASCLHEVVISPATKRDIERRRLKTPRFLCIECFGGAEAFIEHRRQGGETLVAEGAWDEFNAWYRRQKH